MNPYKELMKIRKFERRVERLNKKRKLARRMTEGRGIELEMMAASYTTSFYKTPEWRALRYKALAELGNVCFCCGASPRTGAVIHVDHVLPRSIYPEKALDFDNLQILCEACNMGKSNKDKTDWGKI